MSDNAENKPPKLRLSRDAHPAKPGSAAEDEDTAAKKPSPSPAKPGLKLNQKSSKDADDQEIGPQPQEAAPKPQDNDSKPQEAAPKPQNPPEQSLPREPEESDGSDANDPAPDPAPKPKPKLDLARSKQFASVEEDPAANEANTPAGMTGEPAPERDFAPVPTGETPSAQRTEPPEKKRGFPIASILIIGVMLIIIGGASYGIWYVFFEPGTSANTAQTPESQKQNDNAAEANSGTEAPAALGPIEKAKRAANEIATGDLETIIGAEAPAAPAASAEPKAPASKPESTPESTSGSAGMASGNDAPSPPSSTPPSSDSGPSTALQERASAFLSAATIGAVRTGEKARVMLNGTSYRIGDLVHANTGLTFTGTKDQRLVFRDRNGVYYVKSF